MVISLNDLRSDEFDILQILYKRIEPDIESGILKPKDYHRANLISVEPSTFKMKCENCGNNDYCKDCNDKLKDSLSFLKDNGFIDFDFDTNRNRGEHPYSFTNCKLTSQCIEALQELRSNNG